jgi:SAM-dependent methyltransferase
MTIYVEATMRVTDEGLRQVVREKYGEAAREAAAGRTATCGTGSAPGAAEGCGCGCTAPAGTDPITGDLYSSGEAAGLPAKAVLASLGCGNPTALAELSAGETVLDLGSGGGIDVLLSARRVGPTGFAYGLDMTEEMLELARQNQREAGVDNAEFLRGEIESIPLPDDSVDVIISNCVINLSADKGRVLAEAFRVLRPGGRFAVSDIVVRGDVDARIRDSIELWIGCVAGALEEEEYVTILTDAGFEAIDIEPTRVYGEDDLRALTTGLGPDRGEIAESAAGKFMSAFVRARKPI